MRRSPGAGGPSSPSYGWQARVLMHYVYLLTSESRPGQKYIGYTTDLKNRLREHNNARSPHTSKFVPWQLVAYFAFETRETAVRFERYSKSGSGRAFAARNFFAR